MRAGQLLPFPLARQPPSAPCHGPDPTTPEPNKSLETFSCHRGALFAERRNRGYNLCHAASGYHAASGQPVVRFRPAGQDDRVEVLYWSLWKERWARAGPLGRAALSIDRALDFIAAEDIFWTAT